MILDTYLKSGAFLPFAVSLLSRFYNVKGRTQQMREATAYSTAKSQFNLKTFELMLVVTLLTTDIHDE